MRKLIVACLSFFILTGTPLLAKEYTIPTRSKDITATLTPLSQGKLITMLKIIANFPNYSFNDHNPIDEFAQGYMVVDIVIKNNSPNEILLARGAYLKNGQLFLADKNNMASPYGTALPTTPQNLLLFTSCCVPFISVPLIIDTIGEGISNNWQDGELFKAGAVSCLTALSLTAVVTIIMKEMTKTKRALKAIFQAAELTQGTTKKRYKAEETTYKIPAGSIFRDKLLIDLKKVPRTFLDDYYADHHTTSLLYKEVTK